MVPGHVAGGVVRVSAQQLVVGSSRDRKVFRRTLGHTLAQQIAPCVVRVAITPIFSFAINRSLGTIRSAVLRRSQPIQRVVSKALVSGRIFVVGDGPDITVVADSNMKIIINVENRCTGRSRRHVHGLQALVEAEAVADSSEADGLPAEEARQLPIRPIRAVLHIVDVVPRIQSRQYSARRIRFVCNSRAAGIGHALNRAGRVVGVTHVLGDVR